jgi:hypothetical protein
MSGHVDEQLIQRCVDNELTAPERHLLLQQLETSPGSWKTLACTYMEEQLFAAAVVDADRQTASRLSGQTITVMQTGRHWLHHPLTSVALSACVALLLGLLIAGNGNSNSTTQPQMTALAEVQPDVRSAKTDAITSEGPLNDSGAVYRVQLESDGGTVKNVPVVDDPSRYLTEYESLQQRLLDSLGSDLPRGDSSPEINFIRLPLQDGRVIVVPVESFLLSPRFQ